MQRTVRKYCDACYADIDALESYKIQRKKNHYHRKPGHKFAPGGLHSIFIATMHDGLHFQYRDNERYVRGLLEEVEGHLNSNDPGPY